jgi:hypothetical protein
VKPKRCARPHGGDGHSCDTVLTIKDGWWVCIHHGKITQHGLPDDPDAARAAADEDEKFWRSLL